MFARRLIHREFGRGGSFAADFSASVRFHLLIGVRGSASGIGAISAENAAFSQETHRDEMNYLTIAPSELPPRYPLDE
jgi:hypothetical protein